MFTERELKLIAILLGMEDWLPGRSLAKMLGVGSRTLQAEVADINTIFRNKLSGVLIQSNNRLGYRLEGDRSQIKRFVDADTKIEMADPYENARSILTVLLYERDYLTLNQIADKTYLASSSVSANLEKVKKLIGLVTDAKLDVHPRKGYRLLAAESKKRMLIMSIMKQPSETALSYPAAAEGFDILKEVRDIVSDEFLRHNYIIEGEAFDLFAVYCAFSIARQDNGYSLEENKKDCAVSLISRDLLDALKEGLGHEFTEAEVVCLDERLNEFNLIGSAKKEYPAIEEMIRKFIDAVYEETGLRLISDYDYLKRLSEHLHRMSRRLDAGNLLVSEERKQIKRLYPVALHLVKTCLRKTAGMKAAENEELQIAPFISTFLSEKADRIYINIVSDEPVSLIYHFRMRLYDLYGSYIEKIRIYPTYLYRKRFADSDKDALFFTTEEELVFENREVTYIELYEEDHQMEMILNQIRRKWNEVKNKRIDSFDKRFKDCVYEYDGDKDSCFSILAEVKGIREEDKLSVMALDQTLLAISHENTYSDHAVYLLKEPIYFEDALIEKISYFNIGRDDDARSFCTYIQNAINKA